MDPARRATNPTNPPEASPYLYVGNNPINYTDPTGESVLTVARAGLKYLPPVAAVCYVCGALTDVEESLSDELGDLSDCFNPADFLTDDLGRRT